MEKFSEDYPADAPRFSFIRNTYGDFLQRVGKTIEFDDTVADYVAEILHDNKTEILARTEEQREISKEMIHTLGGRAVYLVRLTAFHETAELLEPAASYRDRLDTVHENKLDIHNKFYRHWEAVTTPDFVPQVRTRVDAKDGRLVGAWLGVRRRLTVDPPYFHSYDG